MKSNLFTLFVCFILSACASSDRTGVYQSDAGTDTGSKEQAIGSWSTFNYVHGTCDTRKREKCVHNAACPGNARCMVPATKALKVAMVGEDRRRFSESWKFEIRRMLSPAVYPTGEIELWTDGWTATETSVAESNLVITRGSCTCVTSLCANPVDLLCFAEPNGAGYSTNLVESLPGTYTRPATASTKRYMYIDINKMDALQLAWSLTSQQYHFVLEHTVRWGIWSILGVGSFKVNEVSPYPDNYDPFSVMRPDAWNSLSDYNFANGPDPWEMCLLNNYSLSSSFVYTLAPAGCSNN